MTKRWLGNNVPYNTALELQADLVSKILANEESDQILLLEHEPVYTIGRTRDQSSLKSQTALPHPVIEINRGGQATYHGPGQLIAYPILDLTKRKRDLHLHLRNLEEALIISCQKYQLTAHRKDGLTGVWVDDRKIASLGVGVRKWISMHGLAINITPESLPPFKQITPCGIQGVSMTCLWDECHEKPTPQEFGNTFYDVFTTHFGTI